MLKPVGYYIIWGGYISGNTLCDFAGNERQGDETLGLAGGLPGLSAFTSAGTLNYDLLGFLFRR